MKNLFDLKVNENGTVEKILSSGSIKRRLLDIGLIKGTKVTCVSESPAGDPKAFLIRGAVIAIRSEDCKNILIRNEG